MDSLFAKLLVFLSLLLGIATGNLYIDSSVSSISLDYNEGDEYPVMYNLDIKNVGPGETRFDIESNTPWIFVYKDYEPARRSVRVPPGNTFSFTVEIHPEQALDGMHEKSVTVNARNPRTSELYETRIFEVNINKNVVAITASPEPTEEPTPTAAVSPTEIVEPTPTEQPLSTIEPTPIPLISETLTPTPMDEPSTGARRSIWFWFWNFVKGKLF